MSVASPVIDSVVLATKHIFLKTGIREYHPVDDIYKEIRNLRRTDETLRVFDMPVKAFGAVPKGGGKFTPRYAVFYDGWTVVPEDVDHSLYISGEQLTEAGTSGPDCLDLTVLSAGTSVIVHYEPPTSELVKAEAEIAAINRMSFENVVSYDSSSSYSGTTDPLYGNKQYPLNNLADVITQLGSYSFDTIEVFGDIELVEGETVSGYRIIGQGASFNNSKTTVTMTYGTSAGPTTMNTIIEHARIEGYQGGEMTYEHCIIGNVTNTHCEFIECGMIGPMGVTSSTWGGGITNHTTYLRECYSGKDGFTIDYNASPKNLVAVGWNGDLNFQNITDSGAEIDIRFGKGGGTVTFEASCTALDESRIKVSGVGKLVNNGTGTIDDSALINKDTIADSVSERFDNLQVLMESNHIIPADGTVYFRDPVNGNDSFDGLTKDTAVQTFAAAEALVTDGENDVVFILNTTGSTLQLDEQWDVQKSYSIRGPGFGSLEVYPTSTSGPTIRIRKSNIDMHGFKVRTSATDGLGDDQWCIDLDSGVNNVHMNRLKIARGIYGGVRIQNGDGNVIENSILEHMTTGSGTCVQISGDSHENVFIDNFIYDAQHGFIINGTSHDNWIKGRNLIHDILTSGILIEDATVSHLYVDRATIMENINGLDVDNTIGATGIHYQHQEDLDDMIAQLMAEQMSSHDIAGSFGSAYNTTTKMLINKRAIVEELGVSYLYVYDNDGFTPILKKALKDIDGNDIASLSAGVLAIEEASSV